MLPNLACRTPVARRPLAIGRLEPEANLGENQPVTGPVSSTAMAAFLQAPAPLAAPIDESRTA